MLNTIRGIRTRLLGSLRGRLLTGLAATWLIIALLLLALAWLFGRDLVGATSLSHLRYEAELVAAELSDEVEQRFGALEALAERLQDAEAARAQALVADNRALLAWFEGLIVTDREGAVLADWPVVAGRVGIETRHTDYFNTVRATRMRHVSEPFIGRASGQRLLLMLVPRLDASGAFQGVVAGVVNLARGGLFRRLEMMRLGERGGARVYAASGESLFQLRAPAVSATNAELTLALDGWEGEAQATLASGEPALVAYRQVWPADWIVSVTLPAAQVYAPLGGFLGKLWWAWLGGALLLLLSMRWLVARLLAPLERLERQIAEVGSGRRHYLAAATRMDELRQLADTFNALEHERLSALGHLREREAFLDAVLASSPVGVFVADLDGQVTYMNPALRELLGLDSPRVQVWWGRIHPDDRSGALDLWRHTLATGSDFVRQLRYRDPSWSTTLWLDVHARQVSGREAEPLGFVGMIKDITEHRQQEALQRWEAEHDPLTGLLNRRGFERRLEEALAEYAKTGTPSVLILFDLDHFKPINDEGGHALGDEMLRRIAQVVAWEVRRSDHVARQGGDEFAVLLPSCTLKQAARIAEALLKAVGEVEVTQAGREYRVTLSVGVAALEEGDTSIEAVLRRADDACYRAKAGGRNAVVTAGSGVSVEIDELFS